MKIFLAILLILHGLIHLMGFFKAFNLAEVNQLNLPISRSAGLYWLLAGLLFLITTGLIFMKVDWWWMIAAMAIIISQVLIIISWQDAKYGTILNLVLLLIAVAGFGMWNFNRTFENDFQESLSRTNLIKPEIITEKDLQHLPFPVKQYLRYSGVLSREKVNNVKLTFTGQIRGKGKDWMKFSSTQYNFYEKPTRLFYMNAVMKGLTVPGYHAYKYGSATMKVRLFGLIPVVDAKGPELNKAETVTIFNDMCLMSPATLISKNIHWQDIDSSSSKATFTCNGITISAILSFNKTGQLINFVSDDRYALSGKTFEKLRFSTPVYEYKNVNGFNVCSKAEAIWHYPEGEFVYGKFELESVDYNTNK